jgi:hypothetical protein
MKQNQASRLSKATKLAGRIKIHICVASKPKLSTVPLNEFPSLKVGSSKAHKLE